MLLKEAKEILVNNGYKVIKETKLNLRDRKTIEREAKKYEQKFNDVALVIKKMTGDKLKNIISDMMDNDALYEYISNDAYDVDEIADMFINGDI